MNTEPNTAQNIVDAQLAELQITSAEVTGATYKEQHDAKIAALAAEEAELPTPTDKASLQVVQDFITKSEKARTGIDKWRKAFKDQWKKIIDPVDAYIGTNKENGMQARLYEIQQRAEAKKKAYLDEQAKAQREAEQLLEQRYQDRFNKLIGAGMVVDATGNLTIRDGDLTLSALPTQIRFATDEQMAAVMVKVEVIRTAQIEREEAARQAKEAEEREAQELKDRLAKQQEEQEAQAAKLKAEREAFEKEKADMRRTKNDMRFSELETLGGYVQCRNDGTWIGPHEPGGRMLHRDTLADVSDENWAALKVEVRESAVKVIEEQKERNRQHEQAVKRGEELKALGAEYMDLDGGFWMLGVTDNDPLARMEQLRTMTSDEWAAVLARFKEAAEAAVHIPPFVETENGRTYTPAVTVADEAGQVPQAAVDAIRERVREPLFTDGEDNMGPIGTALAEPILWSEGEDNMGPVRQPLPEGSAVAGDQSDYDRLPALANHPDADTLIALLTPTAEEKDKLSGEPLTIESAIFQALGEASMCWDPRPDGLFQSAQCKEVGDRLVATLKTFVNFGE